MRDPLLDILYRDEHFVAVDKPAGMVVHRTRIAEGAEPLLQMLRDQIGRRVYPVHRLDRPTSGVILFALSPESARGVCAGFESRVVDKRYWAVVRGYTDEEGIIDYPLAEEKGKPRQEALTRYSRLATVELPLPVGPHPTARYSLVEARPETGRMHQIRKHLRHIAHPIIGDTTYCEGRQNRLFRHHLDLHRLMLFARELRFEHPYSGEEVRIRAGLDETAGKVFRDWGWPID